MSKSNILHKKSFIDLNESDLEKLIAEVGEKNFRINQINNWIYNHFVKNWSEMINLPKSLINQLEKRIRLHPLELIEISGNETDTTRKFLFKTIKGNKITGTPLGTNSFKYPKPCLIKPRTVTPINIKAAKIKVTII